MNHLHQVLVIGVGSIGERHLRCLQSTGRCNLAFCEPLESRRAKVASRYGITQSFTALDEALNTAEFEAAVICSPAPTHVPMATMLARLGLHLLIEKPLSTSMQGVDELAGIVLEKNLHVALGFVHRAHPAIRAVKDLIEAGDLGQLHQIRMDASQPFGVLRPAYRDIYFASHEQGGGALQDALTHMYNVGEWLAGPIDRIISDAAHQGLRGVEVEDTVHSLTRQGRVLGTFACNLIQHPNEVLISVIGEAGTARIDYARKRWSLMTEPIGTWQHVPVKVPERDSLYIRQDEAWLDQIEGHGHVLCDLDAGIQTLRVNLASMASIREGTWQTV